MQAFEGKVAVITGAAEGIGRALAERSGAEGMKFVLAESGERLWLALKPNSKQRA